MKVFVRTVLSVLCLSILFPRGYFIYKFTIDSSDLITLEKIKFVDSVLKPQINDKAVKSPIVFNIKDDLGKTLFQGEIPDPRMIHHEDFSGSYPLRHDFVMEKSSFVIKSPVINNQNKIEFYRYGNSSSNKKLLKIHSGLELKVD